MLVYFWASWRSVCRLQQGTIENIARDRDVVTVALRSGDMGAVQRHLAGHALTFPVLNDPHGAYAAQSGGDALPALAVGGRVARLGAQPQRLQAGLEVVRAGVIGHFVGAGSLVTAALVDAHSARHVTAGTAPANWDSESRRRSRPAAIRDGRVRLPSSSAASWPTAS